MTLSQADRDWVCDLVDKMAKLLLQEGIQFLGSQIFPLIMLLEEKGIITDEEFEAKRTELAELARAKIAAATFEAIDRLRKGSA